MAFNRLARSSNFSRWYRFMVSLSWNHLLFCIIYLNYLYHDSMVTWCNSRINLSRIPHFICNQGSSMRYNPIYYIWSSIFLCILLSIFSQKFIPYTRTWVYLTTYRNSPAKPICCPTPKHSHTSSFWCNCHMSTPQTTRTKPIKHHPSPSPYCNIRRLFHIPSSKRIPRSLLQNRW